VTPSRATDQPVGFAVHDLPCDSVAGVAVCGEVEIATAPALMAAVEEAVRRSHGPFVIDMAAVDFLDSTGIHCLVRTRALLGRDDRPLAILRPHANVRRVLVLAGLDTVVPLYESYDELARSLRASS
jgi:anti-anti-sigma factor